MCAVRPRNATTAHVNRGMTSLAHTRKRGVGGGVQRERERVGGRTDCTHAEMQEGEEVLSGSSSPGKRAHNNNNNFLQIKKKEGMK